MTTIKFIAHPGHHLAEHHEQTEYTCSACKTTGDGARYRCTDSSCRYDLHHYCATCPAKLSSFMHPAHQLVFGVHHEKVPCDVCAEVIDEYFYRCKDCNFNVHPICTLLPQKVYHKAHEEHLLTLQKGSSGACVACAEECPSWRYRCGIGLGGACNINIHIDCVLEPYSSPNAQLPTQTHPPSQTRDLSHQKPVPPLHHNPHGWQQQPQPQHHYNHNQSPHPYVNYAWPQQPQPHPYYNNHGYQNPSAPYFPPQQPIPGGYVYNHKANAPPPQPLPHVYYQNPPYQHYKSYHGYNPTHNYAFQPHLYNYAHPFAIPASPNALLCQTPHPPPCYEAGYANGVPSGPSGHKVDNIVRPSKDNSPKKGKRNKIMWEIAGRLVVGVIYGVLFGVS